MARNGKAHSMQGRKDDGGVVRITSGRPDGCYRTGISIDAFEVGDEVYAEFEAAGFNMADISRKEDKWHINLPECNRRQLAAMGLKESNIKRVGGMHLQQQQRTIFRRESSALNQAEYSQE